VAHDAPETSKEGRHTRHRRRHGGDRHGGDQRFDRPRRERERPPAAHAPRYERHERREKVADPNSPFAKLAALKAQLEADAKERR
jgi:ATP-dependent RNA helicase SUPV3L1/SUV3